VDEFVNIIFWIDLVVNFFFTFQDARAQREVGDLRRISCHYLKTFFALNLIACLPSEYVGGFIKLFTTSNSGDGHGDGSSGESVNQITRLLRLQRISRLSRLARLTRLVKLVSFATQSGTWQKLQSFRSVRIFNFVSMLFWSVHMLACGWYLCAAIHNNPAQTWVGRRIVGEFNNTATGNVEEIALISQPRWIQWAHSMYFVLTVFTTVGFGDMSAGTVGEICYVMVTMIIGCVIHGWLVSEMINVVSEYDQADIDLEEQLQLVASFATHTEVTEKTAQDLTTWVTSNVRIQQHYDRSKMRDLLCSSVLPRHLMESFATELFDKKLATNRFLLVCKNAEGALPPRFPLLLGLLVDMRFFENGEFVYFTHDQPFNLFIVLEGCFADVARPSPDGGVSDWMPSLNVAAKQLFGTKSAGGLLDSSSSADILISPRKLSGLVQKTGSQALVASAGMVKTASTASAGMVKNASSRTNMIAKEWSRPLFLHGDSGVQPVDSKSSHHKAKPVLWPYMFHCFGDYFGDIELLNRTPRRSSIRCMANKSKALVLAKKDVESLIEDFPRFGSAWRIASKRRETQQECALERLTVGRTCKDLAASTIQTAVRVRQSYYRSLLDPAALKKMEEQGSQGAVNDQGASVKLGNVGGSATYYCGRQLMADEAIAGSNGECGPKNGPQCFSCQRYQASLKRPAGRCVYNGPVVEVPHQDSPQLSIARPAARGIANDENTISLPQGQGDGSAMEALRLEVLSKQASLQQEMNQKLLSLHDTLDLIRAELGPLLKFADPSFSAVKRI